MYNIGYLCTVSKLPELAALIYNGDAAALLQRPRDELLRQVAIDTYCDVYPIQLAIYARQAECLRLLVPIVRDDGAQPMWDVAVREGVRYLSGPLLELTLDAFLPKVTLTDKQKCDLLESLSYEHNYDAIPPLEQRGLTLAAYGGQLLRVVCRGGTLAEAQRLLERGADANYSGADMVFPYGSTPLAEAAAQGHRALVRLLVESYGADATRCDAQGGRPLTRALRLRNDALAAYLRSKEPAAWHDMEGRRESLRKIGVPESLLAFLSSSPRPRIDLRGNESGCRHIDCYSLTDAPVLRLKASGERVLVLSLEVDEYSDLLFFFVIDAGRVAVADLEHGEAALLDSWEGFMAAPAKVVDGILDEGMDDLEGLEWEGVEPAPVDVGALAGESDASP